MKYFLAYLPFFLCLLACSNEASSDQSNSASSSSIKIDYDDVSQQICGCVDPLAKLNKEIEFLVKTEKKDKAMELLKEVQLKQEALEDCIQKIEDKYDSNGLVENKKIFSYLKKKCPDTAAYLSGE